MNNWKIDYRVKYHIIFTHIDGRTDVKKDSLVIEANTPDDVERIIIDQFENSDEALTELPEGWFTKISNEELEIDEVIKLWEY
jgi:hypothetical protein